VEIQTKQPSEEGDTIEDKIDSELAIVRYAVDVILKKQSFFNKIVDSLPSAVVLFLLYCCLCIICLL